MTDPRSRDLSNPHYQLNCAVPDGIDIWLKHHRAYGESEVETFERHLTAERDFPKGNPVLREVPVHNV